MDRFTEIVGSKGRGLLVEESKRVCIGNEASSVNVCSLLCTIVIRKTFRGCIANPEGVFVCLCTVCVMQGADKLSKGNKDELLPSVQTAR